MASAPWASNPWVWVISFKRVEHDFCAPAKERPILFRGSMVRAILEGRKTQTRRVVKSNRGPPPTLVHQKPTDGRHWVEPGGWVKCPYGKQSDRLWVRETWCPAADADGRIVEGKALYAADNQEVFLSDGDGGTALREDGRERSPWRPSIHMPRWACRLVLEVTDVRVERLQDISEEDAVAEGESFWAQETDRRVEEWCRSSLRVARERGQARPGVATAVGAFRSLWESIHG